MKKYGFLWLKFVAVFLVASLASSRQGLQAQDEPAAVQAAIKLSFDTEDSVKMVTATVTKTDAEGKTIPAPEVELTFYAKKSFGLLPIGDAQTTDENGEAKVEFPRSLPGDRAGNVTVLAKFEDNEELGSMETMQTVKWGIPVQADEEINQRALWASGSNAPWPLVITVSAMVGGVWAVIIYILVLIFQIKKAASYEIKKQN